MASHPSDSHPSVSWLSPLGTVSRPFRRWLSRRRPTPTRSRRPQLEALEDRSLLDAGLARLVPPPTLAAAVLSGPSSPPVPDLIIQLTPARTASLSALQSLAAADGVSLAPADAAGQYRAHGPSAALDRLAAALAGQPYVQVAEREKTITLEAVPNDPSFTGGRQWDLNGTYGIQAPAAWNGTVGSTQVTVAVIDTGIDYDHPDLYQNVWINQAEVPDSWYTKSSPSSSTYDKVVLKSQVQDVDGDGLITFHDLNSPVNAGLVWDNNGDGAIDAGDLLRPLSQGGWESNDPAHPSTRDGDTAHPEDFFGWNFFNNTNDPFDDITGTSVGHGTHVSGTVGAMGNDGLGIAGINWQTQIMPLKFIGLQLGGAESGTSSAGAAAIAYAALHGARVANASWGGSPSQLIYNALSAAASRGLIFVAAAGNSGWNQDNNGGAVWSPSASPLYPAAFTVARSFLDGDTGIQYSDPALPNVIAVAATDVNGNLASFSNYGATSVARAPGVNIYSTVPVALGGYGTLSGTSMAAPHVTGTIALVLAQHPTWTYQQVLGQVLNNTTPLTSLAGKTLTGGLVNASRLVQVTPPGTFDWNGDGVADLFSVQQSGTASGKVEVNVYDGAGGYQNALAHLVTPLAEAAPGTYDFQFAGYNGDGRPDLYVIAKNNTGSGHTEVHVLSAPGGYQTWLLQTALPLGATDGSFEFRLADYNGDGKPDLFVLIKGNTGSGRTELHVLDGASNYQTWLLHTALPLGPTDASFDFEMGGYNGDGRPDLYVIIKGNTGSGKTEVHVLSAATGYQTWLLHVALPLGPTDDTVSFQVADTNGDGKWDLVVFAKSHTGSHSTEVHVLDGASSFQNWLLHTATGLPETTPDGEVIL